MSKFITRNPVIHETGYFTGYTDKRGKLILQYADHDFKFASILLESRGCDTLIYREKIIGGFRDTECTSNAVDFLSTLSPST
jgi:hypothetical protein